MPTSMGFGCKIHHKYKLYVLIKVSTITLMHVSTRNGLISSLALFPLQS